MFSKVESVGLFGLNAFPVTVEASISAGQPSFDIVGMPDIAVQESKARIRAVLGQLELKLLGGKVTVNLAPASVKKIGSMFDLPIIIALMRLGGIISSELTDTAFIGELSLDGALAPVNGALSMVLTASKNGTKRIFLPIDNAKEASVAEGVEVYGAEHITQIIEFLQHGTGLFPEPRYIPPERKYRYFEDFADVMGQYAAKKAIETAAAGSHNILMLGPPGSGKSMLAKRIPSILPRITFEESIETTQIHSVAGIINPCEPLVTSRPFRAVSHTASSVGLVGGGSIPKPGEISLAHNGVLFLDELPEFPHAALEALRQPLENGTVEVVRAIGSASFPSRFMLVAAMNPCPCGYFGHPTRPCTCPPHAVDRYLERVSGPLLDRMDLHIEVPPVEFDQLSGGGDGEPSAVIRKRVAAARALQAKRYAGLGFSCNAQIPDSHFPEFCQVTEDASHLLRRTFEKFGLSGRAYRRVLKVARTIADLDGGGPIGTAHVGEAVQYRTLDRKYWQRGI